MTLTEFFTARLDEDEARARRALAEWDDEAAGYEWQDLPDASFAHARTHDPARTLREVEAKRAILAEHQRSERRPNMAWYPCRVCSPEMTSWPCPTVRALAAVWSDYPDYRQEWKP